MKTLDLSAAVSPVIYFMTSGTLTFMQQAYTELIVQTLVAQIGSSYSASTPYILYGCVATAGVSYTTITAGAIFYNGEVYIVPAVTGTALSNPTGGNVILCTLSVTNTWFEPDGTTRADPAAFSDGTPRNISNIRSIAYVTGAAGGSGTTNYKFDYGSVTFFTTTFFNCFETNSSFLQALQEIVLANWGNDGTLNGAWVNAGTPAVNTTGSGGFTVGTTVYNKYKQIGNTFFWQLQLTGCTVTGTPNTLRINGPAAVFGTSSVPSDTFFSNQGAKIACGTVDFGGSSNPLFAELNSTGGGSAIAVIDLFWNTPWSSGGDNNLYINIVAEIG